MLLRGAAERCSAGRSCLRRAAASRGCVARLLDANDDQHRSAAGLEREVKQPTGTSESYTTWRRLHDDAPLEDDDVEEAMHRRVEVLDVHASSSSACQTGLGTRAVMEDRGQALADYSVGGRQ